MKYFKSLMGCLSNIDQYNLDFLGFCNKYPLWIDLLDHKIKKRIKHTLLFLRVKISSKNNFFITAKNI